MLTAFIKSVLLCDNCDTFVWELRVALVGLELPIFYLFLPFPYRIVNTNFLHWTVIIRPGTCVLTDLLSLQAKPSSAHPQPNTVPGTQ